MPGQKFFFRKNLFLLLAFLFISFQGISQVKIIRGYIYDAYTGVRLDSVKINADTVVEKLEYNNNGKFLVELPQKYYGRIYFFKEGYYPFIELMRKGTQWRLHGIALQPLSMPVDTLIYPNFPGNRVVEMKIEALDNRKPLPNTVITLSNGKRIGYSNEKAEFRVAVPKKESIINLERPGYFSLEFNVGQPFHPGGMLKMKSISPDTSEVPLPYRNILSWNVNELITGALGGSYERIITKRHSVGISGTYYIHGFIYSFRYWDFAEFTGFKFSPFYRYYISRNYKNGFFVEGKISYGYFDFSRALYLDPSGEVNGLPAISNSIGLGASIGWLSIKTRHFTIGCNIGLQYFPINVPESISDLTTDTQYNRVRDYWNLGGPGSILDIKLRIGGIF